MGLGGQLVRLATKMNFHSPLNYNATCTLMLPKSKFNFFYRKQNKSSGEKHHQDKDENGLQELVVQKLDSAIHRKNHYPRDSAIGFPNTYPKDSDLSDGYRYSCFKQLGLFIKSDFVKVKILNFIRK